MQQFNKKLCCAQSRKGVDCVFLVISAPKYSFSCYIINKNYPTVNGPGLNCAKEFYIILSAREFLHWGLAIIVFCRSAEVWHRKGHLKNSVFIFLFRLPLVIHNRRITFKISFLYAILHFCRLFNPSWIYLLGSVDNVYSQSRTNLCKVPILANKRLIV